MDNRTIQSSLHEDCRALSFLVCVLHLTCHLLMGQHSPPGTTRGHHCEEMALQSAGAHSSSVCFFSTASLSPACPSSPLLFTHRQLSQFPNVVIPSNILCSCFLLFSCSLGFLPLSLCLAGFASRVRRSRLGAEQREEEKRGKGGYICSFMTNHMCFWVFVFTCFSWKRGWWKRMTGEERQAYGSCLLS